MSGGYAMNHEPLKGCFPYKCIISFLMGRYRKVGLNGSSFITVRAKAAALDRSWAGSMKHPITNLLTCGGLLAPRRAVLHGVEMLRKSMPYPANAYATSTYTPLRHSGGTFWGTRRSKGGLQAGDDSRYIGRRFDLHSMGRSHDSIRQKGDSLTWQA